METIANWKGERIGVARSKGGVLATIDPRDNLVISDSYPWPPPEIAQKLYQSNQQRHFYGDELQRVTRVLGYYSDLQSLHSEDAITWSVFSSAIYSETAMKERFLNTLFELIGVPSSFCKIYSWLWRRLPHPETLVSGGPEIDFGIQSADTLLLGEAKWLSKEGKGQGKGKDKSQFDIRYDFIKRVGHRIYPTIKNVILLGLDLDGSLLQQRDEEFNGLKVFFRNLTWKDVIQNCNHPKGDELAGYLEWKITHSRMNGSRMVKNNGIAHG